jgi:hypothetical protein
MSQYNRRDYEENDDWASQVPWERSEGPYRDYGWEKGESALPEFRDPSVHVQPYERQRVSSWRPVDWNREYNYGVEEGPYTGVGPKGYQRSDERIYEDVCERLTRAGQIDARDIRVNVKDGEVTLDGTVPNRVTKRMVEKVADNVRGVKDVHNQLRIERNRMNESGMPGGGQGRVDQVGGSGVYPASGPMPKSNAQAQGEASWGQGERGSAGYEDSGESEVHPPKSSQEKK